MEGLRGSAGPPGAKQSALNQFLQRYALVNQKTNSALTYVCCLSDVVVGFYSLAVGSVDPEAASARVMKGLARHPVPVMILARLAVDKEHQRKVYGYQCQRFGIEHNRRGVAQEGHLGEDGNLLEGAGREVHRWDSVFKFGRRLR